MRSVSRDYVDRYLRDLERELHDLPRARRREIVEEIRSHIIEAREASQTSEYGDYLSLVERIGDPGDVAEEARGRFGIERRPHGFMEIAALILLLVGAIVIPIIGWFVGVALLWASGAWTTREKLIGTFFLPGGLALPMVLLIVPAGSGCVESGINGRLVESTCSDPSALRQAIMIGLFAVLVIVPIAITAYLGSRLRARRAGKGSLT
jgi:hypothetical protein